MLLTLNVNDINCYNFFLKVLEEIKVSKKMDRDTLINVARTSLRTKLHPELADLLTEVLKKYFLNFYICNNCSKKNL